MATGLGPQRARPAHFPPHPDLSLPLCLVSHVGRHHSPLKPSPKIHQTPTDVACCVSGATPPCAVDGRGSLFFVFIRSLRLYPVHPYHHDAYHILSFIIIFPILSQLYFILVPLVFVSSSTCFAPSFLPVSDVLSSHQPPGAFSASV